MKWTSWREESTATIWKKLFMWWIFISWSHKKSLVWNSKFFSWHFLIEICFGTITEWKTIIWWYRDCNIIKIRIIKEKKQIRCSNSSLWPHMTTKKLVLVISLGHENTSEFLLKFLKQICQKNFCGDLKFRPSKIDG